MRGGGGGENFILIWASQPLATVQACLSDRTTWLGQQWITKRETEREGKRGGGCHTQRRKRGAMNGENAVFVHCVSGKKMWKGGTIQIKVIFRCVFHNNIGPNKELRLERAVIWTWMSFRCHISSCHGRLTSIREAKITHAEDKSETPCFSLAFILYY